MSKYITIKNFFIFFLILNSVHVCGQHASIDTTFGDSGIVSTIGMDFSTFSSVAIQSDGKIITAGDVRDSLYFYRFSLARFHQDGALDTSFSNDGMAETDICGYEGWAYDIVLQSDGKIILAGVQDSSYEWRFGLARFNVNGSIDASFGVNGSVATRISSGPEPASEGFAVAIQTDGKIVMVGSTRTSPANPNSAIVRYNSDGTLDNTFDSDGIRIEDFSSQNENFKDVVIQPDGKIVVVGFAQVFGGNAFLVARYNSNGSPDNTFSTDGFDTLHYNVSDFAHAVALQIDGKIVVAGKCFDPLNNTEDFALARYNSNGTLDISFDGDGKLVTSIRAYRDVINDVTIQSNGKILAFGFSQESAGGNEDYALARYNEDGSLDATMNSSGIVITEVSIGSDEGYAVEVQADQHILVTGGTGLNNQRNFALVRYLPELLIGVELFDEQSHVLVYPNPFHHLSTIQYTLPSSSVVSVYLQDITGKRVQEILINKSQNKGEHIEEIETTNLSAGIYSLIIETGKSRICVKVSIN